MEGQEFVTVRVSSELLAQMVAGWSEPVQVKIEPAPGAEPPWTMTCRKPLAKAFLVKGILADGGEITFPPSDVRVVYTDDVTERPAEQPEYEIKKMSYAIPLATGECMHEREVEFNLLAGIQRHRTDLTPCDEMIKPGPFRLAYPGPDCGNADVPEKLPERAHG